MNDKRQISQDEIGELEKDLSKMEHELLEQYCEIGKGILEKVEMESKKVNALVDQIIETRQRLATAKEEKCCKKKLPTVKEDNNGTEKEK